MSPPYSVNIKFVFVFCTALWVPFHIFRPSEEKLVDAPATGRANASTGTRSDREGVVLVLTGGGGKGQVVPNKSHHTRCDHSVSNWNNTTTLILFWFSPMLLFLFFSAQIRFQTLKLKLRIWKTFAQFFFYAGLSNIS
jgi:hypothetical protein